MWRPEEGWDNPYDTNASLASMDEYTQRDLHKIYEDGADAILKALRKDGFYTILHYGENKKKNDNSNQNC